MNMRRHKHFVQNKVWGAIFEHYWRQATEEVLARREDWVGHKVEALQHLAANLGANTPEPTGMTYLNEKDQAVYVRLDSDAGRRAAAALGASPEFEADQRHGGQFTKADKKLYVVAKKTSGDIVGEFDSLDEAEAVIEKAKKAKKAALILL